MRPLRTLASTSIALLVVAAPGLAAASPDYPDTITADLSLSYSLDSDSCTICHATTKGGNGTATKPFGKAMKQAGLAGADASLLQGALDKLEKAGTDSDCNGVPDIEQLKAGQDPNTALYIDGSGKVGTQSIGCGDDVAFGCGSQLSRVPASWPGAVAVVAVLGAALARRRRR